MSTCFLLSQELVQRQQQEIQGLVTQLNSSKKPLKKTPEAQGIPPTQQSRPSDAADSEVGGSCLHTRIMIELQPALTLLCCHQSYSERCQMHLLDLTNISQICSILAVSNPHAQELKWRHKNHASRFAHIWSTACSTCLMNQRSAQPQ